MTTYNIFKCRCGWHKVFRLLVGVLGGMALLLPVAGAKQAPPQVTMLRSDLIIKTLWMDKTVNATTTEVHFLGVVQNVGTISSGITKTRLRVDLGADGVFEYEGIRTTGAKVPGSTEGELWPSAIILPHIPNQTSYDKKPSRNVFQVCADALDAEVELSEGNNCKKGAF